ETLTQKWHNPTSTTHLGPRSTGCLVVNRTVLRDNGVSLLTIFGASNISVEQVQFETTGTPQPGDTFMSMIALTICQNVKIRRCKLEIKILSPESLAAAITAVVCVDTDISENYILNTVVGVLTEYCVNFSISSNRIQGPSLPILNIVIPLGWVCIQINKIPYPSPDLKLGDCHIENNYIENHLVGMYLGYSIQHSWVKNNTVSRPVLSTLEKNVKDLLYPVLIQYASGFVFQNEASYLYGIIIAASNCTVTENILNLESEIYGGMRILSSSNSIENNQFYRTTSSSYRPTNFNLDLLPIGIFVNSYQGLKSNDCIISQNTFSGKLFGIWSLESEDLIISRNRLKSQQTTPSDFPILVRNAKSIVVENNQLEHFLFGISLDSCQACRISNNKLTNGSVGITAIKVEALEVSQNVVQNMRLCGLAGGIDPKTLGGIFVPSLSGFTKIGHNRFTNCGYDVSSVGTGILLSGSGDVCVESCEVIDTGINPTKGEAGSATYWGIAIGLVPRCQIRNNVVSYTAQDANKLPSNGKEHRSLFIGGWMIFFGGWMMPLRLGWLPYNFLAGSAEITNNVFSGTGKTHLVHLGFPPIGFEKVTFSNNQCFHFSTKVVNPPGLEATVCLWGTHIIFMGNHVKADTLEFNSLSLSNSLKASILGNIMTGTVIRYSTIIPDQWENFNYINT
ncbi:MAG: right-handed parallel beta-helix repeat-containing protein, partial [Pleurocapsa sp. MO_226.B13]|nr:right-handed parallel beta-helix repeat-containing protein [Pleurocapsa sp. MO_226.B13]